MLATATGDLLHRLRAGTIGQSDHHFLEHTCGSAWIAELQTLFRLTFQEWRLGRKWELGLARSFRTELTRHTIPGSQLVFLAVAKPEPGLVLTTGIGFKLDQTPDGWNLKPLHRKTVRLGEAFLQKRGCRFDHILQLLPAS